MYLEVDPRGGLPLIPATGFLLTVPVPAGISAGLDTAPIGLGPVIFRAGLRTSIARAEATCGSGEICMVH